MKIRIISINCNSSHTATKHSTNSDTFEHIQKHFYSTLLVPSHQYELTMRVHIFHQHSLYSTLIFIVSVGIEINETEFDNSTLISHGNSVCGYFGNTVVDQWAAGRVVKTSAGNARDVLNRHRFIGHCINRLFKLRPHACTSKQPDTAIDALMETHHFQLNVQLPLRSVLKCEAYFHRK